MLEVEIRSERLLLLPERAVYWPAQKTLIVADLHWGKTGHFRKNGIAIPINTQHNDETRLAKLVKEHGTERLIIAGDFFHSHANYETDNFTHWRNAHSQLHIELVAGNHDILPAEQYRQWNLGVHPENLSVYPFIISHDCPENSELFCIHGHIHPSYVIGRQGRHRNIRLACYCVDAERMILPAFGDFTGSRKMNDTAFTHVYVIAEDEVVQWI